MSANGQHPLLQRLADGKPLISDGAGGTYLQSKGLEPGGSPEEMNASAPETIREMATAYFDAGSDMVLTASFGGSRFMLEKYGLGGRVAELNRLAAHHARSVTPEGGFVVGSVGPTGEILESNGGEVGEEEVLDAFVEQVIALEAGGADAVAVETMISAQEAVLAIQAATENTDLVVFGTMMFDKGPRGWFSMMGDTPESAVKAMRDAGADVVGANCGNGVEKMIELAAEIRDSADGYVLIHSNAGIPAIRKGQIVYPETPEYMAGHFSTMADRGVNIVGGCCGTTPDHIRALSNRLRVDGAERVPASAEVTT